MSSPADPACCIQSTAPWKVACRGTVSRFDLDGNFLESWDSGHWSVAAVRPHSGELLVVGQTQFDPSFFSPGKASRIKQGVASRFAPTTKARLWGTEDDLRFNHQMTALNHGPFFGSPPVQIKLRAGAIDEDGNAYVFGTLDDGDTPTDFKISSGGGVGAGLTNIKGRAWIGGQISDLATMTDNGTLTGGTLSRVSSGGSSVWSKSIAANVMHASVCPDGNIWVAFGGIVDAFPGGVAYGYGAERHSQTAVLASVPSDSPFGIGVGCDNPQLFSMTALPDNGLLVCINRSLGGVRLIRYDSSGVKVDEWGSFTGGPGVVFYSKLLCSPDGDVFGLSGHAQRLDISTGTVITTYNPNYKITTGTALWAESGNVWVGGDAAGPTPT